MSRPKSGCRDPESRTGNSHSFKWSQELEQHLNLVMTGVDMQSASSFRFAPNTAANPSGQLWIASILCLIYCTLVLVVRLHIKRRLYGTDDAAITIATVGHIMPAGLLTEVAQVLQLGNNIPLFIALKNGLGDFTKEPSPASLVAAGKVSSAQYCWYACTDKLNRRLLPRNCSSSLHLQLLSSRLPR